MIEISLLRKLTKDRILLFGTGMIMEAEKQLSDKKAYQEVSHSQIILSKLAEMSNKVFNSLKKRGYLTENQLKFFSYEYRKDADLCKLCFFPEIHKRLNNVPEQPVIKNCGTPTEKCSEFLDHHLKPLMQMGWSYIKDLGDFIKMIRDLGSILENAIFVTANVMGLNPHEVGLLDVLDKREQHSIPTSELIMMTDFILRNKYFQLNAQIKQQISGNAVGTKFAPPYACLFMGKIETAF